MNFLLLEHSTHGVVTANYAPISRILKFVSVNVGPYPLDGLRPGKLVRISPSDKEVEIHRKAARGDQQIKKGGGAYLNFIIEESGERA